MAAIPALLRKNIFRIDGLEYVHTI